MFRPWRSFPTMVASGLVLGLLTGGFPRYSQEISQIALGIAMTFSLTEISLLRLSPRDEARGFLLAALMSYGVLSGLVLLFAFLTPDPALHDGWVLMAAVPPAVAVIPITAYLKGDVRRALVSLALLYLLGLLLVPLVTLALTNQPAPVSTLILQTILLIGVPLLASRPLRRWRGIGEVRGTAVGLAFFVLVFAIAGSTREPLLDRPELGISLSVLSFVRTFVLGLAVLAVARAMRLPDDEVVAVATFGSFKNLGLTVVLAFAVFGATSTLPSIFSLVFEILWLAALPSVFRFMTQPGGGRKK